MKTTKKFIKKRESLAVRILKRMVKDRCIIKFHDVGRFSTFPFFSTKTRTYEPLYKATCRYCNGSVVLMPDVNGVYHSSGDILTEKCKRKRG